MNNQKLHSLKNFKPSSSLKLIPSNKAKTLVPPLLQEVGKLAAGVAAVNTGSATGNPRNKCVLQPGHSLMDWIRLGSSGKDLTGVGSCAGQLTITLKQLADHDKETDAWLAIRGKVYNITHYLPFHPGGPEEIMKGAGKDATHLFDQVHPWVNYDQILSKCYVGRLVLLDPDIDTKDLFGGAPKSPGVKKNKTVQTPSKNVTDSSKQLEEENGTRLFDHPPPRFDWIQKTDSITIIFYTRAFANPQVEINPPNQENRINVFLEFDGKTFGNVLTFAKDVKWPCHLKINYETGKIEIVFKKNASEIWENYGTLQQDCTNATSATDLKLKYCVINKTQVNYNTCILELERVDNSVMTVPLGKHVRIFGKIKGEELSRSYTAVPSCLFSSFKPQVYTTDNLCLMVKSYPNGNISKYIGSKNKYDVLEVSKPLGTFDLAEIENRELFLMLAAGTGLTPMLGLVLFLLERRVCRIQSINLMFFNRSEEDILIKTQLDELQKYDKRFKLQTILSHPGPKWKGPTGHITSEMLQNSLQAHLKDTGYTLEDVYAMVCGPTPFTNLADSLLQELNVSKQQIHCFLG